MDDVFTLKSSAFPKTTRVVSFRGREEISHLYAFEIFLFVPAEDAKAFDLGGAIGANGSLASHADWKTPFSFHGILSTVESVHAHAEFALFRAVLAPRFSRLGLTEHSRLFTQQSVPDILKAVFEENGLTSNDYELQLSGAYATEEHVCQYHESDLAFVSRWMEHLGLYYWFEHGDEAEKLIVTDSKSSQVDLPTDPVRYAPTVDDHSAGAALESFRCKASSLPASVKLKDYDYTKPTLDVSATAPVASNGKGEISVYSGRFFSPDDAQRFAKLRAEEILTRQLEHSGGGTAILRAGYQFTLEDHPLDAMNQKYLAVACEHFGNLSSGSPDMAKRIEIPYRETYHCDVTAIPASVQFRPKRETQVPRIYGLEHGLVDGAADSEYAQIDDAGRYKIKFFFDESDLKDGKASTWVRQMQPHGGGIEGFHFPLRKGTEVVLSFLGGDPDRPVIAGVVNTTTTPSPVTSGNNTRNVIQTGGRNRIELEDQTGIQKISVSTPTADTFLKMGATDGGHELTLHTAANSLIQTDANSDIVVGANLDIRVGGTLTESVTGAVTETYSATQTTSVSSNRTLTVGASQIVTVAGPHLETTNGPHVQTCNATATRKIVGSLSEVVVGSAFREVLGPVVENVAATLTQTVGGSVTQLFTGALTQVVGGAVTIKAPAADYHLGPVTIKHASTNSINLDFHIGLTAGGTSDTFVGGKNSNTFGASVTTGMSLDTTIAGGLKVIFAEAGQIDEATIKKITAKGALSVSAGAFCNISAGGQLGLSGRQVNIKGFITLG